MNKDYRLELTGLGFELRRPINEEQTFAIVSLLMQKPTVQIIELTTPVERLRYFPYQILAIFEWLTKSTDDSVLSVIDLRLAFEALKLKPPANWSQQLRRLEKSGWIARRSGGFVITSTGQTALEEQKQRRLLDWSRLSYHEAIAVLTRILTEVIGPRSIARTEISGRQTGHNGGAGRKQCGRQQIAEHISGDALR
jgi:hypothetical protein